MVHSLTEKSIRRAVGHVDLPAPVQTILDRLDGLRAEQRTLQATSPGQAVDAVIKGTPALQAVLEQRTADADNSAHKEANRALSVAIHNLANTSLTHVWTRTGEDFIAGTLRDRMNTIIDNARPAAEALANYMPDFNADEILRTADPKAIKLFQATVSDAVTFDVLLDYWHSLLCALLPGRAGGKRGTYTGAGWLLGTDTRVGGGMIWANPDHVTHDAIRGRYTRSRPGGLNDAYRAQINLLAAASQPALAGFRLATPSELMAVHNDDRRIQAEREHRKHEPVRLERHTAALTH